MLPDKHFLTGIFLSVVLLCSVIRPARGADFTYNSKGKRNPFIALVTPEGRIIKLDVTESATGMAIEGIVHDDSGLSYAIINGDIVKVGDEVGEYRVLKIENDKVILIKEGETYELLIKKEGE